MACLAQGCISLWILSETMKSKTLAGDVFIGMATVPLLAGLLAFRAGGEIMKRAGVASEDIFQGDRLPILKETSVSDN